ncbi:hypothetical protein DP113_34355 (plasmid) [Brasilonema octagenarum UFV-E1]|uniref:DUF1822 family protein n=2 Tax=Brasilonema TaxID=383614 RepID=A0A856MN03_9CYAN|nr:MULTISPECIES: DUF1822 family protein [Brasilonema]NMF65517.1 hypothetical protein [Brasilonema octagenarum UFV-OR1]QDL12803.1 hypothetical protein DP114_34250 [Brasilonema sennae CENA114]QDL19199.1 hypothetical protein DP113_34355 [Brasilonema octagenarum UFV-E1]
MLTLSDFVNIDTEHIWLQLERDTQEEAWQFSQCHSNPIACYNAYLNRVCLSHLLNWFQERLTEESTLHAEVFPCEESLPSLLEIVNGTAIKVGEIRIVLVPTEILDIEELRVPQEWIDINSWAADYYISVQVNLDEDDDDSSMRLCGFTTHRQLKNQGRYNESDRTYSLPIEQLTENFTLLFATLGLHWQEQLPPTVTLSAVEAQNLLQTLSDTSVYSPRLRFDVPFAQWAALISNEQWRQQLYNQRLGEEKNTVSTAETSSPLNTEAVNSIPVDSPLKNVNLSQWFQQIFAAGWQSIDEVLNSQLGNLAFEFRSSSTAKKTGVNGVKLIDLGMQLGGQSLALMLALSQEADQKIGILVQVHPTGNEKYLPQNLKLLLLESNNILQQIQSRSRDSYIQLNRFKGLTGTSFSIKLILNDSSMIENFSI